MVLRAMTVAVDCGDSCNSNGRACVCVCVCLFPGAKSDVVVGRKVGVFAAPDA